MNRQSRHGAPAGSALPNEIIPNRLPDFEIRGYSTLYLLRPRSEAAQEWIEDHFVGERTMFGDAIVVEASYSSPIVTAAMCDGLEVLLGA